MRFRRDDSLKQEPFRSASFVGLVELVAGLNGIEVAQHDFDEDMKSWCSEQLLLEPGAKLGDALVTDGLDAFTATI